MPPKDWGQPPAAPSDPLSQEQDPSDHSQEESDADSGEQDVAAVPDANSTQTSQVLTLLSVDDVHQRPASASVEGPHTASTGDGSAPLALFSRDNDLAKAMSKLEAVASETSLGSSERAFVLAAMRSAAKEALNADMTADAHSLFHSAYGKVMLYIHLKAR